MFKTNTTQFFDNAGKSVSVFECIIEKLHQPFGGWSTQLTVNEVNHRISGNNWNDLLNKCRKYLTQNGVKFTERDLCFTINYQWASQRHNILRVSRDQIIRAKIDGDADLLHYHHPKEWGSIAWKMLGLSLAQEEGFDKGKFLNLCELVLDMLNPTRYTTLGCVDCFKEFSKQVSTLRTTDKTFQEYREWLVTFHNSVNIRLGKKVLTMDEASQHNYWQ